MLNTKASLWVHSLSLPEVDHHLFNSCLPPPPFFLLFFGCAAISQWSDKLKMALDTKVKNILVFSVMWRGWGREEGTRVCCHIDSADFCSLHFPFIFACLKGMDLCDTVQVPMIKLNHQDLKFQDWQGAKGGIIIFNGNCSENSKLKLHESLYVSLWLVGARMLKCGEDGGLGIIFLSYSLSVIPLPSPAYLVWSFAASLSFLLI